MAGDSRSVDDLVAAHLDGRLDAAGARELVARLEADPDARRRFADLVARDLILAEKAREAAQGQRSSVRRQAVRLRSRPARRWPIPAALAAAAAVLAVVGGWWWMTPAQAPTGLDRSPAAGSLALIDGRPLAPGTPIASTAAPVALRWSGEPTAVVLNPGGRLVLAPGPAKHLALSAGTLSATVAPQPADAPMVVTTPQARIVVVGTRFQVGFRPGDRPVTTLSVEEGRVRLEAAETIAVEAGDRAVIDGSGITLTPRLPGAGSTTAIPVTLRLDAPPPADAFVADHGWETHPPASTRIAHGERTPQRSAGGPWPGFWRIQQWRPGSVGDFEFGPHPGDGRRALHLRPVSGTPSAQVLTRPFPVSADAATVYLTYRTEGSAKPMVYLDFDGERTRLTALPLSGGGWRWAALTPPPRQDRRRYVVVIQNYGTEPTDVLAIGGLLHGRAP